MAEMRPLTDTEIYQRDVAHSVFKHHELFTLQSRVVSYCSWIGLYLFEFVSHTDLASLSLQIGPEKGRMWLLSLYLPGELRGLGFGAQLYDMSLELAKTLYLTDVAQTPSGETVRGDTRWDYLIRNGWEPFNNTEVRKAVCYE